MDTESPFVSVVVAAYNDAAHLAECLDALERQDYARAQYEVIVIDDGSTDDTAAIVQPRSGVRYLYQDNAGPGAARNRGVAEAQGTLVAFTDSDCAPEPGWLRALVEVFAAEGDALAVAGGPHLGHPDDSGFAQDLDVFMQRIGWATGYMKRSAQARIVPHAASCNAMHRRAVFLAVGGFRSGLFPGEDVELDRRIQQQGYGIVFVPGARVFHHRPADSAAWRKMLLNYGESSSRLIRMHGPFRLIHLMPPALLGVTALLLIMPAAGPGGVWAAGLGVCLLGMTAVRLGRAPLSLSKALYFTFTTAFFYSLGYWRGWVARR